MASIDQSQQDLYSRSESSILDQSWSSVHDQSRPSSSAAFQNGTSSPPPLSNSRSLSKYRQGTQRDDTPEAAYFKGPAERRIDQSWSSINDQSRPSSSVAFQKGTSRSPLPLSDSRSLSRYQQSTRPDNTPEAEYFKGPAERRIDQSWSSINDQSRPSSSVAFQNGTSRSPLPLSDSKSLSRYQQSTRLDDTPEAAYFKGPAERRIDQSWSSINDQSRSSSSVAFQNGTSRSPLPLSDSTSLRKNRQSAQRDDTPEAGYFEDPVESRSSVIHRSPDLVSASRKFILVSTLFVHLSLNIYSRTSSWCTYTCSFAPNYFLATKMNHFK